MTTTLLIAWYIFCATLIGLVVLTMRGMTHSRFRDDAGDPTTEVGYEEDGVGRRFDEAEKDESDKDEAELALASPIRTIG